MILAIESSCDETSSAVVRRDANNRFEVLSNIIASQIEVHQKYGGVVPEVASRKHAEVIDIVVSEAIEKAGIKKSEIEAVAATFAPGLIGALLVGFNFGKAFAYALNVPFIPAHHIEGHISALYIENEMPKDFLCLVVSGGHSHIVRVRDYDRFEVLARTRDDAVGEAFDKIARVLGLGYPGGPIIEKVARDGNANAYLFPKVKFSDSDDFSFSGVKTSVINLLHNLEQKGENINTADIAASFQNAVCETLSERLVSIAKHLGIKSIAIAGGVACNGYLKNMIAEKSKKSGMNFAYPSPILCTDNAAMIGVRGFYHLDKKEFSGLNSNATATFMIGENHG